MAHSDSLATFRRRLRTHKSMLERRFGVSRIGIFGSHARGEARPDSDLDVLVHFDRPIGLAFVTLADELEELLETPVDLVSASAIRPNMRPFIDEELVYV